MKPNKAGRRRNRASSKTRLFHADPDKPKVHLGRPRRTLKSEAPAAEREVMTLREAADYLNCHRTTLYRMVKQGDIPAFRLGGSWRFRRPDIEDWIASLTVRPTESKSVPRKGRPKEV